MLPPSGSGLSRNLPLGAAVRIRRDKTCLKPVLKGLLQDNEYAKLISCNPILVVHGLEFEILSVSEQDIFL